MNETLNACGPKEPCFLTSRSALAILSAIVFTGVLIRIENLHERSLWFDEAFSWRLSQFSWPELLERASRDNNPPLYYLVLKLWAAAWGDSAPALRALSVTMAALTIVGVYLFAVEAFTFGINVSYGESRREEGRAREIGLLAAALIAASAFQIRWASEARMYSMGAALAAYSSWSLFRALRCGTYTAWFMYALFTILFVYTHTYALFTLASQALFLTDYFVVYFGINVPAMLRNKTARGAILAGLLVTLCYGFWIPVLLRQGTQVQEGFWSFPLRMSHIPSVFHQMFLAPEKVAPASLSAILVTVTCLCVWLSLLWKIGIGKWYIFIVVGTPFLLAVAVSSIGRNILDARYLLFTHVFFLVASAVLICQVKHHWRRHSLAAIAIAGMLWSHGEFRRRLDIPNNPGARGAASFIDKHRHPGEPVIVCSPLLYYPMLFHTDKRSGWLLFDDGQQAHTHYLGSAILVADNLIDNHEVNTITAKSVWVVDMGSKDKSGMKRYEVAVPASWHSITAINFSEAYDMQGVVQVTEYALPSINQDLTRAATRSRHEDISRIEATFNHRD